MPRPWNAYSPEERIFALFVSRSGDGKSVAAASFPRPYLQDDFDGRFDGVYGAIKQGLISGDGIEFERFYTRNGYEPFQEQLNKFDLARLAGGPFPIKTLEVASVTTMIQALTNSSHKLQGGKKIGNLRMSGPGDFGFEVSGMKQIMDFLQILPCHVIVSAHLIEKWGKPRPRTLGGDLKSITDLSKDERELTQYAANEIVGEKLALRDQPGEVLLSCFSNVFRFSREIENDKLHYYVEFATDMAKNAFGIPPGRFDITGKPFYPFLQELIGKVREGMPVKLAKEESNLSGGFKL